MANTMMLKRTGLGANRDHTLLNRMPLVENTVINGSEGKYEILCDALMDVGGEALIYRGTELATGKTVVVKLYDQFCLANKANREAVIGFLKEYGGKENHIMPLIDDGYTDIRSCNGDICSVPFSVLPFCEGNLGEIKKLPYHVIKTQFIPAMIRSLHLMHEHGLVHRDIKPGNLYIYDGAWVIGDFGIASVLHSEIPFAKTTLRRGSIGYASPDIAVGMASASDDFFSLAITIAELYQGRHPYSEIIDSETDMFFAIKENGIPVNCRNGEEDLQWFVDGIGAYNSKERAAYEDVLLWLEDSKQFAEKFIYGKKPNNKKEIEFTFEGNVVYTKQDLAKLMVANWDIARGYLFRGGVNGSLMIMFANYDPPLHQKLAGIIENCRTVSDYDMGLAQAIFYIDCTLPYVWQGRQFNSLKEISAAIVKKEVDVAFTKSMFESKYLSWRASMSDAMGVTRKGIELICSIENEVKKYSEFAHYKAMYVFSSDDVTRQYMGVKTPDEVFKILTKSHYDFACKYKETFIYDNKLHAFFAMAGYNDNVLKYKECLKGKTAVEDIEMAYRLWEKISMDKLAVREHYLNVGPYGWMTWIQKNIFMYEFNTMEAKHLKDKILARKLEPSLSIAELAKIFGSLNELMIDFRKMFKNNIFLTYMNVHNAGLNEITANNSDAFFFANVYGQSVPLGYMRYFEKNTDN